MGYNAFRHTVPRCWAWTSVGQSNRLAVECPYALVIYHDAAELLVRQFNHELRGVDSTKNYDVIEGWDHTTEQLRIQDLAVLTLDPKRPLRVERDEAGQS